MPDAPQSNKAEAVKVFYSYSHKDEKLRDTLEEHLSLLNRDGVISEWHDRGISAGREWAGEIDDHLKSADIILLLVSSSFIASDYCYDLELKLAMQRHEARQARVVPVILRPCKWEKAPFGKLNALPKNAKPVTKWSNRDEAFTDIANGIGGVAEELNAERRELEAPAVATGNARLHTPSSPASSLIPRPPVVGFVARRDKEGRDIVGLLKDELAPDKNQLVALWGPGGSGKTTLAAEAARALRGDFPQRFAWLTALGRVDFGLPVLLDDIATQLGRAELRRSAPDEKAEQVRALLAAAPSLVILDNFETIEPEEQERCVGFLAEQTNCSALVTTRARIHRADVKNLRLTEMEPGDAREFWRRLVEQPGRPIAFEGLDENDLIRRCEANPLVLQWVAGQIELAQRPHDALSYLSQGQGDAAERVFTRSFRLPQLGEDGRSALLALSLFTPFASREALAEVAGFGDDRRRLDVAVEGLSLLWLVESTTGNEHLFLRGLTRELAKSRLSDDARGDEFRRRYVGHFLLYAEAHQEPKPSELDVLGVEKDNILGAMDVAFASRDWKSVMRISSALHSLLTIHGYWDEAVRSAEQAAAVAREAGDDIRFANFTTNVAMIRKNRGEYEEAERVYRAALEICDRLGHVESVAACLHQLGMIAEELGDSEEARRLYDESLSIDREVCNEVGIAANLHHLGLLAQAQGALETAKDLYAESRRISGRLNNMGDVSSTLHQLGKIAYLQGKTEKALQLFNESLELAKKLNDQVGIATAVHSLAVLEYRGGNRMKAVQLFRESLGIFEKLRSPRVEIVRRNLAEAEGLSD